MSVSDPSTVLVQGLGFNATGSKFIMRAFHTASPVGFIYWYVYESPDASATQAPYSSGSLNDIVVVQAIIPQ